MIQISESDYAKIRQVRQILIIIERLLYIHQSPANDECIKLLKQSLELLPK